MRCLEKFWKACNKMSIMVETFFVLYIQDTECLVRCPFCVLQCLEREMNKFIQDGIYIYIHIYTAIHQHFLNRLRISKILPQISGLRI